MNHIGDVATAWLMTLTGVGWGLYFLAGAVVVGATVAVEEVRKGRDRG